MSEPGPTLRALVQAARPIADADWARAEHLAEARGERLASVLTRLGLIAERDLAAILAGGLGLRLLDPAALPAAPVLPDRLAARFLRARAMIPLADLPDRLVLALADPLDAEAVAAVRFVARKPLDLRIGCAADLDAAWTRLYGRPARAADGAAPDGAAPDRADAAERLEDMASDAPVIRLVHAMIQEAADLGASDIHLEPMPGRLRLRLRIDGVLRERADPPAAQAGAIVARIKVMARLDIAERRLAQDGRIRLAVRGRELDLRVATTPGAHGEGVVLRLLSQETVALDFAAMGFAPALAARLGALLARPHGILLATGPTGSGKTTTMYAALSLLNRAERKILTIEDPIEYQIVGVNQLQVQPRIGLTFASALRSFLRQDPDVMLVGEIRDLETAQVAVQAALTGHLILSTLHTNSAAGAVTRLLDMGVADYLMTATLTGIVGQRLVRRLCPACRAPAEVLPEIWARLGAAPGPAWRAVGCADCGGSGYRGRVALAELLVLSDTLRRLVLRRADTAEIEACAAAEGMMPLRTDGAAKVARGETTVEEVLRVVGG